MLLTLPDLTLTYSVEVKFVTGSFPLRVTNHLSNQLDAFLRPSEEESYSKVHGPTNILRRQRLAGTPVDGHALVRPTPAIARGGPTPTGPSHSRTRGYVPSAAALRNVAMTSVQALTARGAPTFTADELAARTPRTIFQALSGDDAKFWLPGILKDFDMVRRQECFRNITSDRPHGQAHRAKV
jgi:hypothetical protein